MEKEQIVEVVCTVVGISYEQFYSRIRKPKFVSARAISSAIMRKHLHIKLKDIGKALGGYDHTSVIHLLRTMDDRIETEQAEREWWYESLTRLNIKG